MPAHVRGDRSSFLGCARRPVLCQCLWVLALVLKAGMDLGVAYGIWAATGVALTAVASYLLFKEPFTWLKSLGVVLIVGGVLLVEAGA